ncbi:hypothetical protein Y1Q_0010439 [Alligator mississippiensis]|uniref:Uncharacterized protein n=1 Tax=Alligator mississippiensis TaxID=8496 RepID=A0A151NVY0_ALLMI|nr:hypothetical protein Y1Q_0010439 [Alligator mississippiensis]
MQTSHGPLALRVGSDLAGRQDCGQGCLEESSGATEAWCGVAQGFPAIIPAQKQSLIPLMRQDAATGPHI